MHKPDKETSSKNLLDESKYDENITDSVKQKNKALKSKQVINK